MNYLPHFFFSALSLTLAGCATPIMKPMGEFAATLELRKAEDRIQTLAERCWSKEKPLFPEGIIISRAPLTPEIDEISVARIRDAKDGVVDPPFFRAEFEADPVGNARVRVQEAWIDCGFFRSCRPLGLSDDVKRWLAGGQACR